VIKVLVADDHAVVRRGLRQILMETPDIIVGGEAASRADVLRLLRDERFDAVVLDINIPGASGLDLLADLRREYPGLPILVLTVYPEEQYGVRVMRLGAAGFLTKESAPEKLIEAVRKVAAGGRYVSAGVGERLAAFIASDRTGPPHESLSNREFEVMKLIAAGHSVSEIARDLRLSVKTVSTHRARILLKMQMKTNAELTHYSVKNGLLD
jgi:DNA-binding NarL/FixJ family response regulator